MSKFWIRRFFRRAGLSKVLLHSRYHANIRDKTWFFVIIMFVFTVAGLGPRLFSGLNCRVRIAYLAMHNGYQVFIQRRRLGCPCTTPSPNHHRLSGNPTSPPSASVGLPNSGNPTYAALVVSRPTKKNAPGFPRAVEVTHQALAP